MTPGKPNITLYKQAKAGLKSLFVQTAQVSLGLIVMLVATGGNPPGWLVSAGFFFGVGFVAWSENKRQSEFESSIKSYSKNLSKYPPLVINSTKSILKETRVLYSIELTSDKPIIISKRQRYDQDQYHRLQKGVKVWNYWKHKNPNIQPTLKDADLSGANLSGINLKDADLSGANLNGINLSSANLSNARLSSANLRGANLRGANLESANLFVTKLISADLKGSNLYNANLIGANLCRTNLSNAKLFNANLSNAKLFSANLSNANLNGANLRGAKMRGKAILVNVDFRNANLEGANLFNAIVNQARFGNNLGIDDELRQDLINRGAIFVDSPEDPAFVKSPVRR